MNGQKAKFTWHYYLMAFGVLLALMAMTLSSWGAVISGLGIAIFSHPSIQFKLPTRALFLILFAVFYFLAFPEASVVQEMMNAPEAMS